MGLSSNQARFLTLTSRQIDLENRVQQICQRRLRLSSELERISTDYNNQISNRRMFTFNTSNSGITDLSVANLNNIGYKVMDVNKNSIVSTDKLQLTTAQALNSGYDEAHIIQNAQDFINKITGHENENFILTEDLDMSSLGTLSNSAITNNFTGKFDGNGHAIKNLSIDTNNAAINNVGLFRIINGGSVKNLVLDNIAINATKSLNVGGLAGATNNASIDNISGSGVVTGDAQIGGLVGYNYISTISNSAFEGTINASRIAGGIAGYNILNSKIENSYSSANIVGTGEYGGSWIGSFVGVNNDSIIQNSYATGDVTGANHSIGGFIGENQNGGIIDNSYSTGNASGTALSALVANDGVGGFVGINNNLGSTITNSYATGDVSAIAGISYVGGFAGQSLSSSNATNFYQNNMSTTAGLARDGNVAGNIALSTAGWDSDIWDKSATLPLLTNIGPSMPVSDIEEGLRSGKYSLVKEADQYTQKSITIDEAEYEKIDWRTAPQVADELYKADDTEAENKYDRAVSEINAQDKKLQLEQSSIEVQYKAVTSEKEAVKKILDTNVQSSFKYFS